MEDPCDWKSPDFSDPKVQEIYHIGCDHEAGYCLYTPENDDDDEEDCQAWIKETVVPNVVERVETEIYHEEDHQGWGDSL